MSKRSAVMSERFLLEWLSKEDSSAYGECRGQQLNSLVDQGLVQILNPHHGDYARVMLTDEGWNALKVKTPAPQGQHKQESDHG